MNSLEQYLLVSNYLIGYSDCSDCFGCFGYFGGWELILVLRPSRISQNHPWQNLFYTTGISSSQLIGSWDRHKYRARGEAPP